jgi:hypothetical protein
MAGMRGWHLMRLLAAFVASLDLLAVGCTIPGAVAPSTIPVLDTYVELSLREISSSCGYTILTIPVKNPQPISDMIEDMIRSRGGDALVEVSSSSSTTFYLLGVAHCVEIRGKIVRLAK